MKRKIRPLIFFLAAAPAAAARLETSVHPPEVRVGDRLTLSVSLATAPAETPLPFSPPPDFGPFELVSASSASASYAFVLTTFEVGTATIPALTFRYLGADGKPRAIQTPQVPVTVKSVLPPGASDLKDIKGTLRVPPGRRWLWPLVALGLAGAAAWIWRKTRGGTFPGIGPRKPPPVAPDVAALDALDRLEEMMDGPSKPYYSRLTEVFRTYIEGRFGLPALDRTTAEMIPLLKELPLAAEDRLSLRDTLDTADLAKFARFESSVDERRRHRDRVRAFVLSTRPRPPEEAPPA